ncbi:hypothetical protein C8F04DRAFT_1190299 [Mycena alexandri]|uniref:Uncharacterized protein n=1 Tax=Mycena alexandri TaxID=1745969 RepID=A0AAD6SGR5_9AGAR|nr:hypothetical protein C8F04DRAFT_1194056 [Mycena alexandri]KAJ7026628.1 hypothetical protein C8F04DRAFT_1190299 [Mycena alexandri]
MCLNRETKFVPVSENAEPSHPDLFYLLHLAVPAIARILAEMNPSNPVIRSFRDYFQETRWKPQSSVDWMSQHSFVLNPALEAMLFNPLAMLKQHELLRSDPEANKKIFGPGSVLLQILVIQHSLGDPWNLNGATFTDIQSGHIIFTPPLSFAALDAMRGSIDVPTCRERRGSNYMQWQLQFDERHTSFDMSSWHALVLHHRVGSAVAGGMSAPAIRIEHDGKIISSATDLPPIGPWLEARRCSIAVRQDILDSESDDEPPRKRRASGSIFSSDSEDDDPQPKKKGGKYVPKPTPPGVRRSTRAGGYSGSGLVILLLLPAKSCVGLKFFNFHA